MERNMKNAIIMLSAALILLVAPLVSAENSTEIEGYVIHHNAITTDILTPEIARHYGIIRSRNRAMLNVSVMRKKQDALDEAVPAEVKAYTTNLYGQQRKLVLNMVEEGSAIYYIGDFLVRNGDRLNFHIDVKPEGERNYSPATFTQEFYTE
ncbi:hypothetical protein JV46_21830 [Solemya velum gill symbiont]|uniref:DUF4426 domain-containing protein n=2 Tax=Solemya velum gill symbiont TaxID=2340 RepID=A0A0B0HFN3_SOVGS|nr:hypothetical protein JV46_21830 [Solemya velum gill symbiont]